MELQLAPMEGITSNIYRAALNRYFPGIGRYYTPFISATKNLNAKQDRDVDPANNEGMVLIPQFMAHTAEDVIAMQAMIHERYGHTEINLNQGCPSKTVVGKNHGSGFLRDVPAMEAYLDELFERADFPISVKTRIGVEEESEWPAILEVYKRFPFSEVIIHPRTTRDQYGGKPRLEAFEMALEKLEVPVSYNGDINTLEDYVKIRERFPKVEKIMIGRGILRNPMLINAIKAYEESGAMEYQATDTDYESLNRMMDQIKREMQIAFSGDRHVLDHLKELWTFLSVSFPENKKEIKMLKKSRNLAEYDASRQLLFNRK